MIRPAIDVLSLSARRAWIEIVNTADKEARKRSLSARRAWIEILMVLFPGPVIMVALRKESVDRNTLAENPMISVDVALRKESVDRNSPCRYVCRLEPCRSPQGERG